MERNVKRYRVFLSRHSSPLNYLAQNEDEARHLGQMFIDSWHLIGERVERVEEVAA